MTDRNNVLDLQQVTVRRRGRAVLDDVTFSVAAGTSVAVGGANGSGKTTVLRLAANLYRPDRGRRIGVARSAFVPPTVEPPAISAERWVRAVPRPNRPGPDAVFALAERLGFDAPSVTPCRSLSFGNLRKLLLAEALTSGEALIVIDEATSGLDEQGVATLASQVLERCADGAAVVVADQGAEPTIPVDRYAVVANGQLVEWDVDQSEAPTTTVVSLTGPVDQRSALLLAAARLGYEPVEETPP
jgi:ABC-type multidrug transport system ATPase subunit